MIEQYWFRALAIAFASFVVFYFVTSAISSAARLVARRRRSLNSEWLFAMLAAPLLLSISAVAFLVVPSFLRFEPMVSDEPTNWALLSFAVVGAVVVVGGVVRASGAWIRTSRCVREWTNGAVAAEIQSDLPILVTEGASPAAVVAGIARPTLLISRSTAETLNSNELRLVVAHELEHARRRDNLRKLLLAANFMPFRRRMEQEWMLACELSADRAAVANGYDACDLAAALVKVSRLSCGQVVLAANFAAANPEVLEMRVKNLISWEPQESEPSWHRYLNLVLTALAAISVSGLIFSGDILRVVHRVSELWMN